MSDYVVTVTIWVQTEQVDAFLAATRDNISNTRKEPGNLQFDCARSEDDATRFHFYERYASKTAFQTHQQTPHYLRWRAVADPIMAQHREGRRWTIVLDK